MDPRRGEAKIAWHKSVWDFAQAREGGENRIGITETRLNCCQLNSSFRFNDGVILVICHGLPRLLQRVLFVAKPGISERKF
jgi:hypothetical protein